MSLITPDFGLIFWMTLIFAIVFFILAKFGFPIITGMVEKRNIRISESIKEAHKAEEMLRNLSSQQAEILEQTRRNQAEMLKEASQTRDNIISQAKQQAQEEASKIINSARIHIEAEKESALRDIRAEVASLSVEIAGKVLRQDLSSEDAQLKLVDKMVNELKSSQMN